MEISDFVLWMAHVQAAFRELHIAASRDPRFAAVHTQVIPHGRSREDVTLSFSLLADRHDLSDASKQALGISLLLRQDAGGWVLEAETGWSGKDIGWDVIDDDTASATSVAELLGRAPVLVEWLSRRFNEIADQSSRSAR